jgi:hypothetical protein
MEQPVEWTTDSDAHSLEVTVFIQYTFYVRLSIALESELPLIKIQFLKVNIDVTCAGSNLTFFLNSFPNSSICTVFGSQKRRRLKVPEPANLKYQEQA